MDSTRSTDTPKISVLLPAFNEETLISSVIASVRQSFEEVGCGAYEIVVCDNNSTDQTAEIAKANGATVVFEAHNQISRARNRAAAEARGQWLIFMDADTFLSPQLLRATIDRIDAGNVCGGGSVIMPDRNGFGAFGSRMLGAWNAISRICRLAAGSYIFCSRQAWADVGGFDERIYAGEELFFSRRIRKWGRRRRLRFVILTDAPIVTSARKFEWYGPGYIVRSLFRLSIPGALRRRANCEHWYTRPSAKE